MANPGGPAWDRALDWLLRVNAAPEDRLLRAQRDAWLAAHDSHAAAYRQAERVWLLTGAVPPAVRPRPVRWLRGGLAAAAALAACLVLWLASNLGVLVRADYHTSAGEMRDIALPDGSTVSLDADSAIAVGDRSVELLAGRAFFQVKRDPAHAFTVKAGEANVAVLGTAFDVLLSERSVTIAVQRGSVSVATSAAQAVTLQPGQRAFVDRADGAITAATVGVGGIAAWRTGMLVVEGLPVADVIEELDRHRAGFILLRDPILGARRITGVFDLRAPDAALRAVLRPYGGRILEITPYVLVVQGT
ncbi:MAG TPA: FecR domain-containing protein [Dongiaceae bacterium]|nr:FecR domain-containing protein [Dongiaceae bacterium]